MIGGQVSGKARLPIALVVATGHEAGIVKRALRTAKSADRMEFDVVQVGVGCCDMDSNGIVEAYSAIVSTGFAGALAAKIESGSMLLPEEVKNADNTAYDVDPDLQKMIVTNTHATVVSGPLLHTEVLLATTEHKKHAHDGSRCVACDMESATLAAAAKQGGRPFACLRIVLDPANTAIPIPIVSLANTTGDPTPAAFLQALLRHPREVPITASFLWHTFKASRALSRSVKQLIQGCGE